jgi:hypothetical protein
MRLVLSRRATSLVFLLATQVATITAFRQRNTNSQQHLTATTGIIMAPPGNSSESAVLRELKEKIATQAKEIASLRKQVVDGSTSSSIKAPAQQHGAHGGGGPEMMADEYLQLSFLNIASKRIGWLSLFLVSLSLTALIMNGFENTLHRQLELAYFVP